MGVKSDNGRELFGGSFGKLCRKREFTPADRTKYNGVAERALALINDTALPGRIQAPVLYPGAAYLSLWAGAVSCHVPNRTETTTNSGDKPPYEMWYDSPLSEEVWLFPKPAVCIVRGVNKSQPRAQDY